MSHNEPLFGVSQVVVLAGAHREIFVVLLILNTLELTYPYPLKQTDLKDIVFTRPFGKSNEMFIFIFVSARRHQVVCVTFCVYLLRLTLVCKQIWCCENMYSFFPMSYVCLFVALHFRSLKYFYYWTKKTPVRPKVAFIEGKHLSNT